jgi:hypothetical protein
MALDKFVNRPSDDKNLKSACDDLWEECIRADLIYGRNLWLCLPCLAFFYATTDADHPRDQCVMVQRYFSDRSITSPAKLLDFMKEAIGHNIKDDSIRTELASGPTKPSMSKAHLPSAPKRPHLTTDSELKKSMDRLVETKISLAGRQEVSKALEQRNEQLKQENETLLLELMHERELSGKNKKIILGLLDQIVEICYDGCWCDCNYAPRDSTCKTEKPK